MYDQQLLTTPLSMTKQRGGALKTFLSFMVVTVVTIALFLIMAQMKPEIETKDEIDIIPTVKTILINPIDYVIPINSEGMVSPKTRIASSAEVSGRIIEVSSEFVNGGTFEEGHVLLRIDPKDYELAITKAKANVSAQLAQLDLEQAKSDLARDDWQKYGKKGTPSALNLNLPQVASAKAALAGAKADLLLAQRNLEKTTIIAPFDGVILSKNVDIGQFVTVGTVLSTMASTEVAEIRVPLSDQQLNSGGLYGTFSDIQVTIKSAEAPENQWIGKVSKIEAQRDAQTLMNFVVVAVDQPFAQQDVPLRFNTFVDVEFAGQTLKGVFPVSRHLMTLDQKIHVLDDESKLQIHEVSIGHSDDDLLYLTGGLRETDRVITTQLAGMRAGTSLRSND